MAIIEKALLIFKPKLKGIRKSWAGMIIQNVYSYKYVLPNESEVTLYTSAIRLASMSTYDLAKVPQPTSMESATNRVEPQSKRATFSAITGTLIPRNLRDILWRIQNGK